MYAFIIQERSVTELLPFVVQLGQYTPARCLSSGAFLLFKEANLEVLVDKSQVFSPPSLHSFDYLDCMKQILVYGEHHQK